jgi:E3 ubiquitin-protein ligase RNF5
MEKSKFECLICLEDPLQPVVTPCGHFFCDECIEKWMKVNWSKVNCPVCKAGISPERIIKMNVQDLRRDDCTRLPQQEKVKVEKLQDAGDWLSFFVKALVVMVFAMVLYSIGFR